MSTPNRTDIENLPLIARRGGVRRGGESTIGDNDDDDEGGVGHQGQSHHHQSSQSPISRGKAMPNSDRMAEKQHNQQQETESVPPSSTSAAHQQQHVQFNNMQQNSSPPSNEFHDNETFDGSEDTPAQLSGPTVTCRVCEAEIPIEGKSNQHVVRCMHCNEVTPIRAAPPGKKYVRCPCNCLLVCKASSTRIACPRQNCRRVITLVSGPHSGGIPGTAIRAPVGTCRVQCAYCQDIFMFNTLTNQLAICPHCRKNSSVGASYTRSRLLLYFVILLISSLFLIGVIMGIAHGNNSFFMYAFMTVLLAACGFLTYRFVFFMRIRVSQVLGPL